MNPPRSGPADAKQWPLLEGLGLALAVSAFARRSGGPVLVAAADGYSARRLRDEMQRLAPTGFLVGRGIDFRLGQELNLERFRRRLSDAGYESSDQVWQPGQFAVRGAVFDLWPMGAARPYRIELFDTEIESIRTFDAETQRSIERLEQVELLPGREYPFDEAARQDFRRRFRTRFDVDLTKATPYQDVGQGIHSQGLEQYLPLFFEATCSLLDYLPRPHRLVMLAGLEQASSDFSEQIQQRFEQRCGDRQRPALKPEELYFGHQALIDALKADAAVRVTRRQPAQSTITAPPQLDLDHHAEDSAKTLAGSKVRVLLAADTAGRRELIHANLARVGIRPRLLESWSAFISGDDPIALAVLPFSGGCCLPEVGLAVLSESELFPGHTRTRRHERKSGQDPESLVRSLAELQPGALVVHLEHGIGRYLGLEVLDVGDTHGEFLALEYAGADKLYVPVTDLHRVSRYTGADPESVTLNQLGSDRWKKTRRKAAEKVRDAAAELLNIQARRAARVGQTCAFDAGLYARFAAGFEFEETEDQQTAIDAVLGDLRASRPMDRVVCGDVGFGKTEVALRAAFAVTDSGRQVAMLAPTTLLAEQHYRGFADRFADWPVKVALMSRTGGKKQAESTLQGLADGTIDIVIGTHRLLQKDIRFKNLGLVVIDEEQRFGVRQKEQFKKLRAEVDLLTLTATPIPRTLNMSMMGLRELSIIATPPSRRMAVRTFVSEWDSATIRDAVSREFQRGGQVYFLHNEVRSQPRMVDELSQLFPRASIGMAHGQMPANEMERTMRDFYARRINLLVASTIIENGIDVPTANTIIINRADKFGLAQLHQLRGRVGRSHHLAYAYLITPPWKLITTDARKRLEAIQSLQELGAGFTLATHDLEIRGAGELLGEGQSGQIEAIGFQLYSELLNRTVEALKAGIEPDLDEPVDLASEVDLHTTSMIPNSYLPDVHQRLVMYKRIAQATGQRALHELQVEMIDRFGLLPDPVRILFISAELRLQARAMGIRKLEIGPAGGRIEFLPKPEIDMGELIRMIQKEAHSYSLPASDRLRIHGQFEAPATRIEVARELLIRLGPKEKPDNPG
ncbi:MAG: transcription-repair coupling factor [Xanthomonadaceae bacterium]|nr:transcription-repair coupling factor [Xanthomonadaceae bacterium]